jgi:hypothetical protein
MSASIPNHLAILERLAKRGWKFLPVQQRGKHPLIKLTSSGAVSGVFQ